MNVFYRIVNVIPEEKTFTVRYWSDVYSENSLASSIDVRGDIMLTDNGYPIRCATDMNLTFNDNHTPTNEDVIRLIEESTPYYVTVPKSNSNVTIDFSNVNTFLHIANSYSSDVIEENKNKLLDKTVIPYLPNLANLVIKFITTNNLIVSNTA
jgi:hypothetical protein